VHGCCYGDLHHHHNCLSHCTGLREIQDHKWIRGETDEGVYPLTRFVWWSQHNKSFKLLICMWWCEQVALQTTPNLPPCAFPCLFPFPIQVKLDTVNQVHHMTMSKWSWKVYIPILRMWNWNQNQPVGRWHHPKPKQSLSRMWSL